MRSGFPEEGEGNDIETLSHLYGGKPIRDNSTRLRTQTASSAQAHVLDSIAPKVSVG